MLPMLAPIVHENVLGEEATSEILGLTPLHMVNVEELVTVGTGLTVTIIVKGVPVQVPDIEIGVTM